MNEWMTAVREHASALTDANQRFAVLTPVDRTRVLAELARLRDHTDSARAALTAHRAEHGC